MRRRRDSSISKVKLNRDLELMVYTHKVAPCKTAIRNLEVRSQKLHQI